jgi:hypothetical protein
MSSNYYDPSENLNPVVQGEENKIVNKALSNLPAPHISGLKLRADIKLGDLTLNTIDSNSVVWVCTDLEGWWNLPDPELPDLPRGWGDGSYDAKGRYAARLITLTGSFLTQDPDQVEAARQTLFSAIDLVYSGADLIVNESPVVKTTSVRLSGRPEITTVKARGRTDFSIGLKAADPIKYEYLYSSGQMGSGETLVDGYRTKTLSAGGNSTFTNAGTFKVPTIIELTGPINAGATIVNAINYSDSMVDDISETITLVKAVPNGSTLEIDSLNRDAVLVTGSDVQNARSFISTLSDWVRLEPSSKATNTITFTGSGGSCKVYFKSGWIG